MGYFEDIYASPEKHGLRIVETHEEEDLYYEFHMVVLWEDVKTKKRWWGQDSGCSCPSPFENYHSVAMLSDWSKTKKEYEKSIQDLRK